MRRSGSKQDNPFDRRPPDLSAYIDDLRYAANVLEDEGIGGAVEMAYALVRDAHDLLSLSTIHGVSCAPTHAITILFSTCRDVKPSSIPESLSLLGGVYDGGQVPTRFSWFEPVWTLVPTFTMVDGHRYDLTQRRDGTLALGYSTPILPGIKSTPNRPSS